MKNIEIEFKALVSKELFDIILSENKVSEQYSHINHYFDTEDEVLNSYNMALRIREKDHCNQITIKHKVEEKDKYYYIEVSDFLGKCELDRVLEENIIESEVILDYLMDHNINLSKVTNYNVFTTNRTVCKYDDHILFLDENIYANGNVDYELEVESLTYEECERSFNYYLRKYNLERNFMHKIERAIKNK